MRALVVLLIASSTLADIGPRPMPKPSPPGPMKPEPKRAFAEGPRLSARDELRTWLDQQGSTKRVRLPVLVKKGERPGGVEKQGFVGDEKGLALELDDTALGVSLADRYHQFCKEAASCVLLLDGTVEKGRLRVLWVQALSGPAPTTAQVEVQAR